MFDNKVIYLHNDLDDGKPCLIFNRWKCGDGRFTEIDHKRTNITGASWERVNKLLSKSIHVVHQTSGLRVWIGFWF